MRWPKTRREWQAGTTLVEVLVATTIMALALALIVGTLSTGLLDSVLAKRNTASTAVLQYELDSVGSAQFSASPQPYSDCFATEDASSPPTTLAVFQGACPSNSYTLRADVSVGPGPLPATTQQWTVTIVQWPGGNQVGRSVSVLKVNR
jgi:type II secretory pathway pseudopilin PulG